MPETFNFDPNKPLSLPKTGVTMGQNLDTRLVSQSDPSKAAFGGYYGDKNNILTIDPYKNTSITAKPGSSVPLDWGKVDPFGAAKTDQQKGWLTAGWGNDSMPLGFDGVEGTQAFLSANPQLMELLTNMGVDMGTLAAPSSTAYGQPIPGITGPKVQFDRNTGQLIAQLQDFDEASYLAANPDIQAAIDAGVLDSGREHYFTWGKNEGRELGLPVTEAAAPDPYASPNDIAGTLLSAPTNFYDSSNVDRSRFYNAAGDLDETFKTGLNALIQAVGIAPNGTPTTAPAPTTPAPTTPAPTTAPTLGSPEWSQAYLAQRPDVQAAINAGLFPDAATHWNQYGQYEAAGQPVPGSNDPLNYGYQGGETNFFPAQTANDGAFDEQAYLANNPDVAAAVASGAYPSGQAHWEQMGRYEPRFMGGETKAADTASESMVDDPLSVIMQYLQGGEVGGFNPQSIFSGVQGLGSVAAGIANPAAYASMLTGGPVLPNPVAAISIANMINGMFEEVPGVRWGSTIMPDGTVGTTPYPDAESNPYFSPSIPEGTFDPTKAFANATADSFKKALADAGLTLPTGGPPLTFDYRYGAKDGYATNGWSFDLPGYQDPTGRTGQINGVQNTKDLYAQAIQLLRDLNLVQPVA